MSHRTYQHYLASLSTRELVVEMEVVRAALRGVKPKERAAELRAREHAEQALAELGARQLTIFAGPGAQIIT